MKVSDYIDEETRGIEHLTQKRNTVENEADEVGLRLAAKACFDVREAPVIWGHMHLEKIMNESEEEQAYRKKGVTLDFLSTHPS